MATGSSPWRYALSFFAVGQLVSPSLVFLVGGDALTSNSTETPITPPGWTFLIWVWSVCSVSPMRSISGRGTPVRSPWTSTASPGP